MVTYSGTYIAWWYVSVQNFFVVRDYESYSKKARSNMALCNAIVFGIGGLQTAHYGWYMPKYMNSHLQGPDIFLLWLDPFVCLGTCAWSIWISERVNMEPVVCSRHVTLV